MSYPFFRCVRFEMRRAFRSPLFYVMQLLILAVFCVSLLMNRGRIQPEAVDWTFWFTAGVTGSSTLLPLVVSLLCVMPHAAWHRVDMTSNFLPVYVFRTNKRNYIAAKCVSMFCLGALVVLGSLFLCLLLCHVLFPSQPTAEGWLPAFLFSGLYRRSPLLYCLLLIGNAGLHAGVFSLVGLALSGLSGKTYTALIGPFVVSMVLHVVFSLAGLPGLSPLSLLMPEFNANTTAAQVYGEVLVLSAVSVLAFSLLGRKNLTK